MDEAAILSMRRGKYYVGVEFIFEALMTKPDLLPDAFAQKYIQAFAPALNEVRQTEWKGVSPVSDDGEVYYTPRAQEVVREAAKLAEHYRRGTMTPAPASPRTATESEAPKARQSTSPIAPPE